MPAASSAFAVAPTGRNVPRKGLWFFGSPTKAMLSATTVGVSSLPSAHVTPSASVKLTLVPSTVQSVASWDSMAPDSAFTLTSES